MKESALFSKSIRRLLSIFVTNPKKRFYLRQLCCLTGSSPRPVHLALKKLQNAGILNFAKEANVKFYTLNKASPIYSEIKSIILKFEKHKIKVKDISIPENKKTIFMTGVTGLVVSYLLKTLL